LKTRCLTGHKGLAYLYNGFAKLEIIPILTGKPRNFVRDYDNYEPGLGNNRPDAGLSRLLRG